MRAHSQVCGQLRVTGEDGRLPPGEGSLQLLSQRLVQGNESGDLAQAHAVRWVGDDQTQAFALRSDKGGQLTPLEEDAPGQAGPTGVRTGRADGLLLDVVSVERWEGGNPLRAATFGLVHELGPRPPVVSLPLEEAEVAAAQPRSDVCGYQSAFHKQRAGAAHRVQQGDPLRRKVRPLGAKEDGRGQVFLKRSRPPLQPVAPAMEAASGEVEADDGLGGRQMHVDADVGPGEIDARPTAGPVPEAVDDRVLRSLFEKVRVDLRQRALADGGGSLDGDSSCHLDVVFPGHLADEFVEVIGGSDRGGDESHDHPAGHP